MPHLQFETTITPDEADQRAFTEWVTTTYADVMDTGTGHVAVSVRERSSGALSLGRADPNEPVAVVNADVRAGRSEEQRRTLATAFMDELERVFDIPAENCYVVYTTHPGPDFQLREGPLASWSTGETDPTDRE